MIDSQQTKTNRHSHSGLPFWLWLFLLLAPLVFVLLTANEIDRAVARNTLALGIFTAAVAIPLGSLIAWSVSSRSIASRLLLVSVLALVAVPVLLQASAWDSAFGKLGWLTSERGQILKPVLSGWYAAVWIHAVAAAPQVAIIVLLFWSLGRPAHEEQALLDADPATVFIRVTIPRMAPAIFSAFIWIMINCSREIAVTDLYRVGTLAEQIYLGFSLGQVNMGGNWTELQLQQAQNTGPWLTLGMFFWIAVLGFWLFSRLSLNTDSFRAMNPRRVFDSRGSKRKSCTACGLFVLIAVIPIGNLITRASFYVANHEGIPTPSYSIAKAFSAIGKVFGQHTTEFHWSLLIAIASATAIMTLAIVLCWFAPRNRLAKWTLFSSLALTSAIPGPLIGRGIVAIFSDTGFETVNWLFDYTIFAPTLAVAIFCWPFAALCIWFIFALSDPSSRDPAQLEGAGEWRQLVQFGIIGQLPAMAGAWLLTFVVAFGELSASHIALPPGMDTVPRLTLGLMHAGVNEMTAALTIVTCSGIILVSLAGWGLLWLNNRIRG